MPNSTVVRNHFFCLFTTCCKVKKMIKDLIVRLMEEANEEAKHKGWRDTTLSTNEQKRKEKTAAVETLHVEIDELEASIAKFTEDNAELTKVVAELDVRLVVVLLAFFPTYTSAEDNDDPAMV